MPLHMDASQDDSYEKVGAGGRRLPAGFYHVEIVEVDETFQKESDKVLITFEVLAGTIPGNVGARHTEYFATSERAMDRLKRLAMICGLIKSGEQKDVTFNDTVGRVLVIEMVPHSYESKKTGRTVETTQLGYGNFWDESHADVKDVPRGKSTPRPAGNAPSGGATEQGQQAAAGGDKWGAI